MSRGIAMPAMCLTCGYGEVPGERFNDHECADFRALPDEDQRANRRASFDEARRRVERARAKVDPAPPPNEP